MPAWCVCACAECFFVVFAFSRFGLRNVGRVHGSLISVLVCVCVFWSHDGLGAYVR